MIIKPLVKISEIDSPLRKLYLNIVRQILNAITEWNQDFSNVIQNIGIEGSEEKLIKLIETGLIKPIINIDGEKYDGSFILYDSSIDDYRTITIEELIGIMKDPLPQGDPPPSNGHPKLEN
jgi:hypothetical protein